MDDLQRPTDPTTIEEVQPSLNQSGFPDTPPASDLIPEGRTLGQMIGDSEQGVADHAPMETPVTQQPEPSETTNVPEKFKGQDGQPDSDKLQKATVNVEEALNRYSQMEAELRRKQNSVHQMKIQQNTGIQEAQPAEPNEAYTIDQIGQQIENELKANGTGKGLARILNVAIENAYQRGREDTDSLRQQLAAQERRSELQNIAESDPEVFSPNVQEAIQRTLAANPWLSNAPQPITAAYKLFRSENPRTGGVVSPTPTPPTAPATPAGGPRPPSSSVRPNVNLDDPAELNKYLDGLSKEDQERFWLSQGFPKRIY